MYNKKTVEDIECRGKRVLVRCDFNVPMKDGKITNDNRITAALPTINKLVENGAKVILCSHLGKPKNGPEEKFSLKAVPLDDDRLPGGDQPFFLQQVQSRGYHARRVFEEGGFKGSDITGQRKLADDDGIIAESVDGGPLRTEHGRLRGCQSAACEDDEAGVFHGVR